MLKITRFSQKLALKTFGIGNNKVDCSDVDRANKTMGNSFKSQKLKNNKSTNLIYISIIGTIEESIFYLQY